MLYEMRGPVETIRKVGDQKLLDKIDNTADSVFGKNRDLTKNPPSLDQIKQLSATLKNMGITEDVLDKQGKIAISYFYGSFKEDMNSLKDSKVHKDRMIYETMNDIFDRLADFEDKVENGKIIYTSGKKLTIDEVLVLAGKSFSNLILEKGMKKMK